MAVSPPPSSSSRRKKAPKSKTLILKDENHNGNGSTSQKRRKRQKSPGVRVKGSRIYDSRNGRTCHQCRQKTMDLVATCKSKTDDKQCPISFCRKCLLNRYGEEAEEMALLNDWMCPRCRGICNCSFCMKKRGSQPTGILVYTAKANGFCSVSEMLHRKDSEVLVYGGMVRDDARTSSKKQKVSNKETSSEAPSRKFGKRKSFEGLSDLELLAELLEVYGKGVGTKIAKLKKFSNKDSNRNPSVGTKDYDSMAQKSGHEECHLLKDPSRKAKINCRANNGRDTTALNDNSHQNSEAENLFAKSQKCHEECTVKFNNKPSHGEFFLPRTIELENVTAEDVRHALHFLEFCEAVRKEPATTVTTVCEVQESCQPTDLGLQAGPLIINDQEFEIGDSKLKELRNKDGYDYKTAFGVDKHIGSIAQKGCPKKCDIPKGSSRSEKKRYQSTIGGQLIRENSNVQVLKKAYPKSIKMNNRESEAVNSVHPEDALEVAKSPHSGTKHATELRRKASYDALPVSQAMELKCVAATSVPAEDVGHVLQFLEFCEVFGEVLHLKKGQPEQLLKDLACDKSKCHHSSIIDFHVQLLSLLQRDSGKDCSYLNQNLDDDSLLETLIQYISDSQYSLEHLQLDFLDGTSLGYGQLDCSKKLRLVNFLCDEVLSTTHFRSSIDAQHLELIEKEKKVKGKIIAEKEKTINVKKEVQDETSTVIMKNGVPLSISEDEVFVSKIKFEAPQTFADTVEASNSMDAGS